MSRHLPFFFFLLACPFGLALAGQDEAPTRPVGPLPGGAGVLAPTQEVLDPAGESLSFPGRPVDLALAPGGKFLYVKDNRGIVVLDRRAWKVVQQLPFGKSLGGSMHGLLLTPDSKRLLATTAQDQLFEGALAADGKVKWIRKIPLPGPDGKGASHACGLALSRDGKTLYVCLSRNNTLAVIDLDKGKLLREIPVGVAPFDVALSADGKRAFVSNWGGRHPRKGERSAPSSGTPVLVDERGIARSGTVGLIDLVRGRQVKEVATGLHPSDLLLDRTSSRLFVANANSDTVTVLDPATLDEIEEILVRPDPSLPFGSACNALALAPDGETLFVANGGNNAVAVVRLAKKGEKSRVLGFLPTAWYPGALLLDGKELFVANVKGFGSRADTKREPAGRSVYDYLGVVSRVGVPDEERLREWTARVRTNARVPQMLRAWEKARRGVPPVPVPARPGEPSVFEHIVYIIKENRTYDQVLGDLEQGRGDPKLCIYGRAVTPNHHALAEQFVLLDNFYCNGVLSADGHAWATEGNATDFLEKSFGGWTRSYVWGDDALAYSSSGFVWDHVLMHGLSFRNYGEFDYAEVVPAKATFFDIYRDFQKKAGKIAFKQSIGVAPLRRYSCREFPGWNMKIPDVLRAEAFLQELRAQEKKGEWPNFTMVFLPQDHTSGTTPGMPTPEAHMADNDLALGRVVEGITRSKFWPKTCIFVIEDDPQNGFDHVDGHRSLCLVISPYTRRGAVVREFYNQTSVLHTMQRMLGCAPMNQLVARSPVMTACFTAKANLTPYRAVPARIPLDRLNPPKEELKGSARVWAEKSLALDLSEPDRAHEGTLNRILWHAARGVDAAYPAALAGPHGKGLAGRGLRRDRLFVEED